MSKLTEQDNIRCVTFTGDNPDEALVEVINWLRQDDGYGRTNLFYFLDMTLAYDGELRWVSTIYCGNVIKHHVCESKIRKVKK